MQAFEKLAFVIIGTLLGFTLVSCGGGGGGGGNSGGGGGGGNTPPTVVTGNVADGFVAGATVIAYQVNVDGTRGAQIGSPVTTDQLGNYTLNLGTYSGPVLISSTGGAYIDTVTGQTIDLSTSSLVLSSILPTASGNVSAQVNPLTTIGADVALSLVAQGTPLATAANAANASVQNYFGLLMPILDTALVNLTTANCNPGGNQASADASAILAGISQLAFNYGVNSLDLVIALIQDVTSDGKFDGLASGAAINVASGTGPIPLSTIEGPALTGLAGAISSFITSTSNVCGASVSPGVTTALSNSNLFTTPPAPAGVSAAAGAGSIIISWNAVATATSYNLYMATATGVTATSTQLPGYRSIPNVTSPYAVSTGLTVGTTYYFVVTAVSGASPYAGSESAPSAEVSAAALAQAGWAQTVTAGNSASSFESIAAASDGSVYAAGYINGNGTFNFGNAVAAAGSYSGGNNSVLVKYGSSGAAQWAQTVTAGSGVSTFESVTTASDGSVYAAGYISGTGTFSFGNGVTVTGGSSGSNLVLVKYSSAGAAQWARTVTAGTGDSSFNSVSVGFDGSVYAAGDIYKTGAYSFGNGVTAQGTSNGSNPVLVKYNSAGAAQWAQTVTAGTGDSTFNGVSVGPDGSVCASGYILGTGAYNFGNGIAAAGTYSGGNILLVKYNSAGAAQWAQTVTAGTKDSFFTSVSVAGDGSVYAAGYINGNGTYNFGNAVTAAGAYSGGINTLLVKYNSAGAAQWAQTLTTGNSNSIFFGVAASSDGSVYVAGYISGTGTYNFGNGMTAAGTYSGENSVLVIYDSSGVARWARTVTTGTSDSSFSSVSASLDGSVYAAGSIMGTGNYTFDSGSTAAGTYGGGNLVLVKYKGSGSITLSW